MPPQTHVILREIVEVTLPDGHRARAVHETISRVMRRAMPDLIQRQCDELSEPGTIYRLQTVEVDLGRLPLAQLEGAFASALESGVRVRLGEALRGMENSVGGRRFTSAASRLELIDHFARTGALPWWADRANPNVLVEGLRFLCREASRDLLLPLRRWMQETPSLRRLVQACGDDDLHGLLMVLQPDAAGEIRALIDAICGPGVELPLTPALRPAQVRRQVWQSALNVAATLSVPSTREELLHDVIRRVGTAIDLSAQELVAALLEPGRPGSTHSEVSLARTLASIRSKYDPSSPRLDDSPEPSANSDAPLAALLAAIGSSPDDVPDGLRAGLARLDPASPAFADDLARWLRAALAAGTLPRPPLQLWLSRFGQDSSPSTRRPLAVVRAALAASPPQPAEARPASESSASRFSDADAFHVDNAGLVILWSFLPPFFARLGLLTEKRFSDEAAQHRAVALLQFLLTQEPAPPLEYFLPLNKVLCGLVPETLFEPGPPVSDEEQAECEQFLAAVIERAPVLRRMSTDGFRGTFLARQGQLCTRDGHWLLRVERETYDVVLDQFPWSFQWVRLPWMSAPMFVEWGTL